MSYTVKANELINWVDRAIDRQKAGSQRSKVILAMQTLILLAGILRAEHPSYPHEEHSYKIYWNARKLLKKVDPELDDRFHQIISQKSKSKGRFNIYGYEYEVFNGDLGAVVAIDSIEPEVTIRYVE